MKRYIGLANATPDRNVVIRVGNRSIWLPPRHDLVSHSPDGFAWGYPGSGPAQLALALSCDVLHDDRRAQKIYGQLKWGLIIRLPQDRGWELSETQIRDAIVACEQTFRLQQGVPS